MRNFCEIHPPPNVSCPNRQQHNNTNTTNSLFAPYFFGIPKTVLKREIPVKRRLVDGLPEKVQKEVPMEVLEEVGGTADGLRWQLGMGMTSKGSSTK